MLKRFLSRKSGQNQESSVIHLEGVGPVTFRRSLRAKRLNISVKALKGVHVSVPRGISFEQAAIMVRPRTGWMAVHLRKAEKAREEHDAFLEGLPPVNQKEARIFLAKRLEEMAGEYGFSYNRLAVRNQKTRWGSCSSRNNINLNMKLVRIPVELRDYVLLHELVHTRIKNHGKTFWQELERLMPGARALDRRLRDYRLELL